MWWLLACAPAGPQVRSAEEKGLIEQSSLIDGRDGGCSGMAFGRSVWTYGDTVLTVPDEDGRNWHHNSYSITDDLVAKDGIGGFEDPLDSAGAPRHFMPPSEAEHAFNMAHFGNSDCTEEPCGARWAIWTGPPIWDEARSQAYVFYELLYMGDPDREDGGRSIATWRDLALPPERPVINAEAPLSDVLWSEESWGAAGTLWKDQLYAFSCDQNGLSRPCRLARVPVEDRLNLPSWEYWDGNDWRPEASAATVLFEGSTGFSLSWNAYLNAWLAVYTPVFDAGIYARTAPQLEGPWSEATLLYTTPEGDDPYDVNLHPEESEEDGKVVYLTWSRNTTGWFGASFPILRVEWE